MTMRHTGVCHDSADADVFIDSNQKQGSQLDNLFPNLRPVVDGLPEELDPSELVNGDECERKNLMENLILGTPDQAIGKLKPYEAPGADYFGSRLAYHLPIQYQKKSLRLFIDEVPPAFQDPSQPSRAVAE
jgi:alkanesulfonate monooxygenase SsuD/methylene tetrahydromethanopterin reductase-like flavin-dependent oxidoreductase (luciferase family)